MKTRTQIIQELEILDRGWENELPNHMYKGTLPPVLDDNAEILINNKFPKQILFIPPALAVIMGIIASIISGSIIPVLMFSLFAGAFVYVISIFLNKAKELITEASEYSKQRSKKYHKAKAAYEAKRQSLLNQLEKTT